MQITFDLYDPTDRQRVLSLIGDHGKAATVEPIPAAPVSVADMKKAVVAAHKKVGQVALDLLAEYGTKCDQIPDEKRAELLARLAAL